MKTSPERLMRWTLAVAALMASTALWWPTSAHALASVRIKEVAAVQGVRNNQLVGYGLSWGSMARATRPRKRPSRRRA